MCQRSCPVAGQDATQQQYGVFWRSSPAHLHATRHVAFTQAYAIASRQRFAAFGMRPPAAAVHSVQHAHLGHNLASYAK
jgi:hypothetical protein